MLDANYGLPTAAAVGLADLKNADNSFIFDITRATGDEHYQSTLVDLGNVQVTGSATWLSNSFVTVTDGQGRTSLNLGRNSSFTGTSLVADGQWFSVTGILNQESGSSGMDGYRLLVTNADAFAVPEPAALPYWRPRCWPPCPPGAAGGDCFVWQRWVGGRPTCPTCPTCLTCRTCRTCRTRLTYPPSNNPIKT